MFTRCRGGGRGEGRGSVIQPLIRLHYFFFSPALLVLNCGQVTIQEAFSVGPSVRQLVGQSVCPWWSISGKTSILDTFCVRLCVWGSGVWDVDGGLDAPAYLYATRPALLVLFFFVVSLTS